MEASNLLAGRARAAAPCVCVAVADASSRPAELCGLGQPASRARALFGTSLSVFSTLLRAVLCTRGCSEPCVVLSLNIGGSGEALGLDILSAWFCACFRHDRPTAAKQTSYEHRLSDAQRIRLSFPVEKDPFARKQGKQMAATLNQQAMEHAMASRPAITDPVAPGVAGFQFAAFLRRWCGGRPPRRESALPLGQKTSHARE